MSHAKAHSRQIMACRPDVAAAQPVDRFRRCARRTALAATIAVALALSHSLDARACSCVAPTLDEGLRWHDTVFAGTVEEIVSPGATHSRRTRLRVDTVWLGDPPERVEVAAGTDDAATGTHTGSSCDFGFRDGARYLVFATRQGDVLGTDICSGTGLFGTSTPSLFLDLIERLGPGRLPASSATDCVGWNCWPTDPAAQLDQGRDSGADATADNHDVRITTAPSGDDGERRPDDSAMHVRSGTPLDGSAFALGLLAVAAVALIAAVRSRQRKS